MPRKIGSANCMRVSARNGHVAVPAVGDYEPSTQAPPIFKILATVGTDGAIGFPDGDAVAADFHGDVAGNFHANGFQAKILIAGVGELAKKALDRFGAIGGLFMGSHKCAVGCV